MKLLHVCKSYFNGFNEISKYRVNNKKTNTLAMLKIFSYFTIIIPLSFFILYGRVFYRHKKSSLPFIDKTIIDQARKNNLTPGASSKSQKGEKENSPEGSNSCGDKELLVRKDFTAGSITPPSSPQMNTPILSHVIQTPDSERVYAYTNDLTEIQKAELQINETTNTLQISFPKAPNLEVTIRRQNIFDSNAQVIVNASYVLAGGGGIDGQILAQAGPQYRQGVGELHAKYRDLYGSCLYVSGHAAMVDSGLLKSKGIDNVIIVAGPDSGRVDNLSEAQLYSCYYNSLVLAETQGKISIAFPSISTGIYSFPIKRAAQISLKAIYDFVNATPVIAMKRISIHFLSIDPLHEPRAYKEVFLAQPEET